MARTKANRYGGRASWRDVYTSGQLVTAAMRRRMQRKKVVKSKFAVKSAFKGPGSRTKTKTKKDSLGGDDIHSGVGGARMVVNLHKPVKGMVKRSGHMRYTWDVQECLLNGAGTQSVNVSLGIGTGDQWFTTTGTAFNKLQSHTRWFDMNPNSKITGNAVFIPAATVLVDRLILSHCLVDQHFVSLESAQQDVVVYWCKAKTDLTATPEVLWANSLIQEGLGNAVMTQPAAGLPLNLSSNLGYPTQFQAYTTPRGSLFFRGYKIVGTHKFSLAAGSNYRLRTKVNANILAKSEVIQQMLSEGTVYPKGMLFCMIVINGQLVRDKTAAGGTRPLTTSTTEVGVVTKVHNYFKSYECGAPRINSELDVTHIPVGAAVADQSMIDIIDAVAAVDAVL